MACLVWQSGQRSLRYPRKGRLEGSQGKHTYKIKRMLCRPSFCALLLLCFLTGQLHALRVVPIPRVVNLNSEGDALNLLEIGQYPAWAKPPVWWRNPEQELGDSGINAFPEPPSMNRKRSGTSALRNAGSDLSVCC